MNINFTSKSRRIKTQSEDGIFLITRNLQKGNSVKQTTIPAKRARTLTSEGAVSTPNKKQKVNLNDQE